MNYTTYRTILVLYLLLTFLVLNGQSEYFLNKLDTVKFTHKKLNGKYSFEVYRPISYRIHFNFTNDHVKENFDDIVSSLEENLTKDSLVLTKQDYSARNAPTEGSLHIYIGESIPLHIIQKILKKFEDDIISDFTITLVLDDYGGAGFFLFQHRELGLQNVSCGTRWYHRTIRINNKSDLLKLLNLSSKNDLIEYFKTNHINNEALKKEEKRLEENIFWLKKYDHIKDYSRRYQLSMNEINNYLQKSIISKMSNEKRKYIRYGLVLTIDTNGKILEIQNKLSFEFTPEEMKIINSSLLALPLFKGKEEIRKMPLYLLF